MHLASWIKNHHQDENKLQKHIIDHKYNVNNPNISACSATSVSPSWTGVSWDANAAKMGYQWRVGNGKKVSFFF